MEDCFGLNHGLSSAQSLKQNKRGCEMSLKINLFLLISAIGLSLNAQQLQVVDLVGKYTLVQKINGSCGQSIEIVQENFLNSDGQSMAIYNLDKDTTNLIIYQFFSLNAGHKIQRKENMFGDYDGLYTSEHELIGTSLKGSVKSINRFGLIVRADAITARVTKDSINYIRSHFNTLSGIVWTKDHCSYERIN